MRSLLLHILHRLAEAIVASDMFGLTAWSDELSAYMDQPRRREVLRHIVLDIGSSHIGSRSGGDTANI